MTEPQVPRVSDLLGPAVDALVEGLDDRAKVERMRLVNFGRWNDVLRGLGGQATLARAHLTREIIATRLIPENTGQPLRDLASSEYFAELPSDPQYAIGEMYLTRQVINDNPTMGGNFVRGVIPAGTKLTRPQSNGEIPLPEADFLTTE